jgi:hypothetical protein
VMAVFLAKYCSADGGSFGIYGKKEALAGFWWRNPDKIYHPENLGTDARIILKATSFNPWGYKRVELHFCPPPPPHAFLACTGTNLPLALDFSVYYILHGTAGLCKIWLPFASRLNLWQVWFHYCTRRPLSSYWSCSVSQSTGPVSW